MSDHGRHLTLQAYDLQLDLLRYYTRVPQGAGYAQSVVASVFEREQQLELPPTAGVRFHEQILSGDVYAVTGDIVDVLTQAAPHIPRFAVEQSDLPSPNGFVLLEKPIYVQDRRDQMLAIRAFGWTNARQLLIDTEEDPPSIVAWLAWTWPYDPADHMHAVYDRDFLQDDRFVRPPQDMMSLVSGIWGFGETPPKEAGGFTPHALAFLRFIAEPWMDVRMISPDRPRIKRAARAHRDKSTQLHVVQLRKAASTHERASGDGESHPNYDHRWLVRGHWRNQWYPSLGLHRPKYIAEHVKGPEDKPLIVREKLFAVER